MVSGTGERTIVAWAALALVLGLTLSAAPAAHSSTSEAEAPETQTTSEEPEPEKTEEVADDGEVADEDAVDDEDSVEDDNGEPEVESPSPSPTPAPTEESTQSSTSEPSPSQTQAPEGSEGSEGEETDQPASSEPTFSCEGGLVSPGQELEASCTVPHHFDLDIPHPTSAIGGFAEVDGHSVIYTAPESVNGTVEDPFTVQAIGPDETKESKVTFTVGGGDNGGPTTDSPDGAGEDSEDGNDDSEDAPPSPMTPPPGSETRPETVPPTDADSDGATSGSQTPTVPPVPGTPGNSDTESSRSNLPFLPIPGMPGPGTENRVPEPDTGTGDETADDDGRDEEDESDEDEDLLAQTGPEQMAWAGSLAVTALALGTAALTLSRRQIRRHSGA